jgi:hypothetical protein
MDSPAVSFIPNCRFIHLLSMLKKTRFPLRRQGLLAACRVRLGGSNAGNKDDD